ncbi:MAG: rhodanese-like domain-containing protein [Winogradskyella sp.]|nr:rhodanese-like domain-containing protein [Winogradskyella sp.]NNF85113.1 rhodanese-like domain-containing protein [Winogradskyella sp.]
MKIYTLSILMTSLSVVFGYAQNDIADLLKKHNTESIPYMTVEALSNLQQQVVLLDAREQIEYEVSHIKDAIFVGYNDFNIASVTEKIEDKTTSIVVYCSVGIRSENIGERLKSAGYKNVYNLFGGIFEWINKDLPVYNSAHQPTDNVHAYSKYWSKWLEKGKKRYD